LNLSGAIKFTIAPEWFPLGSTRRWRTPSAGEQFLFSLAQ